MSLGRLSAPLISPEGGRSGEVELSSKLFGMPVNFQLIALARRVYLANQREGSAGSKTRGEVRGSTRKIYRQKGTGRARHGGIRAPIFVGGGVAFGPRPHEYRLAMPRRMRRLALLSALSLVQKEGKIRIFNGLDKLPAKTKMIAGIFHEAGLNGRVLAVTAGKSENFDRGARNIKDLTLATVQNLSAYDLVSHAKIVFDRDALAVLEQRAANKITDK